MKKILPFPKLRQVYNYDCGAVCMQGILHYYGIDIREDILIKISKTNKHGTKIKGLKKIARRFGLKYTQEKMSIEKLKEFIDKKIPVIIAIQAWSKESKTEWKKDWKDGHYVVVIGYSKNRIYFEDPSCATRTFLSCKELIERWHDRDTRLKKIINWGMAIYRPKKSKRKTGRLFRDYWNRKFSFGKFKEKTIHMD